MGSSHMNAVERKSDSAPGSGAPDVQGELLEFSRTVSAWQTPSEVLDALHHVTGCTSPHLGFWERPDFLSSRAIGARSASANPSFCIRIFPTAGGTSNAALAPTHFTPNLFLARSSLASFTWTETKRMLEPVGMDRWADELGLKYGMRDGFTCPVGGRWLVAFWSKRDLSNVLTPASRIWLQAASSFAAERLEHLAGPDVKRLGSRACRLRSATPELDPLIQRIDAC